jgi:hypothetical protein
MPLHKPAYAAKMRYKKATGTTDIGTNSIDPVDMAGMTLTVTVGANPVLILAHIPVGFDGSDVNNYGYIFLAIDDEYKTGFRVDYTMRYGLLGDIKWLEMLSTGVHTIKIQWYVAYNSSSMVQLGESGFPRQLIILELDGATEL